MSIHVNVNGPVDTGHIGCRSSHPISSIDNTDPCVSRCGDYAAGVSCLPRNFHANAELCSSVSVLSQKVCCLS
jgi:hypothetical protein